MQGRNDLQHPLAGLEAEARAAARDQQYDLAYRLAEAFQVHEQWGRRNTLVFYNYTSDKSVGEWFLQLYSESIQERGGGMDVIPVIGPGGSVLIGAGLLSWALLRIVRVPVEAPVQPLSPAPAHA